MIDLSPIVDAVLQTSDWDQWQNGEFTLGVIVADTTSYRQVCANQFVAKHSPVWLAQLVVALVEERALHGRKWSERDDDERDLNRALVSFNLTQEKYEELKRRLENSVQSG